MHLLEIDRNHKKLLASIRNWDSVKIAYTETAIWLKGFSEEQLKSPLLLQIPHLVFYEVKDNLLFPKGSLLPAKKVPSALLWSSIDRALPVELPSLNHNFFGIQEKIKVAIVKSEKERQATALLTYTGRLKDYVLTAPEVRLKPLQWTLINDKALVLGTPVLPVNGITFWQKKDHLLPTGYDFEWDVLFETISKKINKNNTAIIVWNTDGTHFLLPKESLVPLSISSLRLTL